MPVTFTRKRRPVAKEAILLGLKSGRKLRCNCKDDPLLPWLLAHPNIENGGVVQAEECGYEYSYIEFWWRKEPDAR